MSSLKKTRVGNALQHWNQHPHVCSSFHGLQTAAETQAAASRTLKHWTDHLWGEFVPFVQVTTTPPSIFMDCMTWLQPSWSCALWHFKHIFTSVIWILSLALHFSETLHEGRKYVHFSSISFVFLISVWPLGQSVIFSLFWCYWWLIVTTELWACIAFTLIPSRYAWSYIVQENVWL